jgi:HAD superfamily hydrolase (TIGR01549 family)
MPDCLIFDLFGTLVDYQPNRAQLTFPRSHNLLVQVDASISYERFIDVWEAIFQRLEIAAQNSAREFHMDQAAVQLQQDLSLDVDDLWLQKFVALYIQEWSAPIVPIPGATGLVKRLANHYQIGLISNTHYPPMVYRIIESLGLAGLFQITLLSAEFGVPKPHPQIFEEALSQMKVDADQSVYIGDSYEHDYRGATGVGIDCYLIGKHARVPKDHQLRNLSDLAIYFDTSRQ